MFLLQSFGSNGSGQLGIGHKNDVSTPQPVILPSSISGSTNPLHRPKRIVAGGNHTLLLLSSGELLWTGDATTGACGRINQDVNDDLRPEFRPVDLSPLPKRTKVNHVAATWAASVVVVSAEEGESIRAARGSTQVYSFGSGDKGELGLGPGLTQTIEPTLIPNFPPPGTQIGDLAACMGHVVAVLSTGEVWGWGQGRKGQLGNPVVAAVQSPRRIDGVNFKVVKAVCGREFTCLFGSSETGELMILGADKWGIRTQAPLNVKGWKEVGAGWGSVFVLKDDGTLLSWGRDDHGQLSRSGLGRVEHIAVGSEHTMALTDDGDLLAWGWGEHGNCGPIRQNTSGEKGQRNLIASNKALHCEQGMEIGMISAGCATSWVSLEKKA